MRVKNQHVAKIPPFEIESQDTRLQRQTIGCRTITHYGSYERPSTAMKTEGQQEEQEVLLLAAGTRTL